MCNDQHRIIGLIIEFVASMVSHIYLLQTPPLGLYMTHLTDHSDYLSGGVG